MDGPGTEQRIEAVRELFHETIPFDRVRGIGIVDPSPGKAMFSVSFRPERFADPIRDALHEGVISVAGACGGCVVWSAIGDDDRVSTIDLGVDSLRPGRAGELVAEAKGVCVVQQAER